jgi:molybdopterin-guanine dinucleotide biosynthesis protein A
MGRPKAALIVDGISLADRTAALLAAVSDPVIEVGPGYTSLVHVRESPAGGGPLAAVAAGWAAVGRPTCASALVVATDLPCLTSGLLGWLATHPSPHAVVPIDRDGRPQPLCARYAAADLSMASELVASGQRAMSALLDRIAVTWAPASEWEAAAGRAGALVDVDTPADLKGYG